MDIVLDAPESVKIARSQPVGVKGQSITLTCTADGNPTPSFQWKQPHGLTTTGPSLSISSVKFEHGGTYTCIATNNIEAGTESNETSVDLTVEGEYNYLFYLYTLCLLSLVCLF